MSIYKFIHKSNGLSHEDLWIIDCLLCNLRLHHHAPCCVLFPISQAEEYQVKARAKELDTAKKQAKAKRARTVSLLEASGKLQVGSKIVAMQGAFKALTNMDSQDRKASFAGEGRFTWDADGLTYDSLNALTRALHEKHGQQLGTIQATQYWSLESSQFSLAEEANQLSAAEK